MSFQPAFKTPDSLPMLDSTPGEAAYVLVRKDGQTYRVPVGVMPGAASMAAGEAHAAFAPLIHGHAMSDVEGLVTAMAAKESAIVASTTATYLRGDKAWRDFATDVRAAVLTGLSTATNAVITAADSVLAALGKLQKQVSDNLVALTSHTGNTANPHGTTKSHVGLDNVDNTSDANKPISTATQTALNAKQATLVSATNIKTINGTSLLGSGDMTISGGSGVQATVTLAASVDLNTVTTSGFYRLNGGTPTNVPSGSTVAWGQLIVSRGADTIFQIVTGWNDNRFYMRHGFGIGGTPAWQPWQEVMSTGGESRRRQQRAAMVDVFAASNNMTLTAGYTYAVHLFDGAKTLYLPTVANTQKGDEIEFVNLHMGWGPGGSDNAFVIAMQTGTSINLVSDNMTVNVRCGGFRLKCHWVDASNAWWGVMV